MKVYTDAEQKYQVVPHAGDVDRNMRLEALKDGKGESSPTRGTWIEMKPPAT